MNEWVVREGRWMVIAIFNVHFDDLLRTAHEQLKEQGARFTRALQPSTELLAIDQRSSRQFARSIVQRNEIPIDRKEFQQRRRRDFRGRRFLFQRVFQNLLANDRGEEEKKGRDGCHLKETNEDWNTIRSSGNSVFELEFLSLLSKHTREWTTMIGRGRSLDTRWAEGRKRKWNWSIEQWIYSKVKSIVRANARRHNELKKKWPSHASRQRKCREFINLLTFLFKRYSTTQAARDMHISMSDAGATVKNAWF